MVASQLTHSGEHTAIRCEGLKRRFGSTWAVAGVHLTVPAGQIYAFLGPNGAGKSTTVRMLCTLLAPTEGRAVVGGHDVVADPLQVRLRIGVALQSTALDDTQTGLESLWCQGRFYGMRRQEIARRVAELRDLIALDDALDRRVNTYSGGMRRRLDLAMALVHNPEIVFLDEPTTGLDPVSRMRLWEEVRRLNREHGTTIFLTTQYLEEADQLADRIGIIDQGVIVADGTAEELKSGVGQDLVVAQVSGDLAAAHRALADEPLTRFVEVLDNEISVSVDDGPAALSVVALTLAKVPDVDVHAITLRRPTLDDVFLSFTGHHMPAQQV
ncbi:ATP-binding cassette domain-containing protein [Nonomuraea sp. NPDC050786]|uniref:ATP-binding cassette domain-containing protein n=1 Tax=Nonomuraea sp. NPDC050786 TaxID=3154840 RepID=UPI0033CCF3EF